MAEYAQGGKWPIRNEHRWLALRAEYAPGGYRNDQDVIDHRFIAMISILEVKSVHVVHLEELVFRATCNSGLEQLRSPE